MTMMRQVARSLLDGAVLGPAFPMRHVSQMLGRKYHVATIRRGGKIIFRPRSSDAETFVDIFRNGAYDFSWLKQYPRVMKAYQRILDEDRAPVIIDAGANIGAASIWFDSVFPNAWIQAVEPEPDNVSVLRLNAANHPNVRVIEAAIGSQSGRVSLENDTKESWAVQTRRDPSGTVDVLTIQDVIDLVERPKRLFLVKIDIEGFEADLFSGNLGWLDEVEVVLIEPHDWLLPGAGTSRNFQQAFLERDFEMIISGENLVYLRVGSDRS